MSSKKSDAKNRFRSKTISFRVSPEENALLETYVKLSGFTKQEYITRRILQTDIVVQGNSRVFHALRTQFDSVLDELQRIKAGDPVEDDLLQTICMMQAIMDGLQEDHARAK